jgi:hypothetical protein
MPDWTNAATGVGTLVLAVATFASVRSANRAARVAETALQEQRRPVLVHSRLEDPDQKIMFIDGRWLRAAGGRAAAAVDGDNIYLALSLRNVGSGIAVLQGWAVRDGLSGADVEHASDGELKTLSRDLYVAGGDVGLWQGALRDPSDPRHAEIRAAVQGRRPFTIELLYSDHAGAQRTISRFTVTPAADDSWLSGVGRHWYLDGSGPR